MEDKRVFLVGCILQGLAQRDGLKFGMAEEALAVADAVLQQIENEELAKYGPSNPDTGTIADRVRAHYGQEPE